MKRTVLACLLVAFALPVACGGGGQATNPPATPAPTDTGAASAAPVDTTAGAASAGNSATAAATTSAPPASSAPPGPPGPGDWANWSHDQKMAYMKSTVMGAEKTLFSGYDAKKYGDMKCNTCHGSGAADGSFKMPSADLPKLDATPDGFKKMAKGKNAKIFDFMMKQVEPQTAQLLGEQPYDPKTQAGFGCFNCHTKK
jgi:hypothetical protein